MKVLHVETGRHLYGGALQVCYLIEGLAGRGVENVLVCTRGSQIAQTGAPFATVESIPISGDLDLLFPLRLLRLIRSHKPDLVHVHSRRAADLWSGLCARLLSVPALLTRRVDNPEWPPFARFKYGTYDRIVSISEGIRQVLLSEGLAPDGVTLIHSVVPFEKYQQQRDREWFASEFNIPAAAPVIGVIAQMISRKGHRFLLEVMPRLLNRFPDLRVLFFGQGPLQDKLKNHVAELGLEGVVGFAGFRKDMPKILPCLDLVVHPALMEGLGVSLLQAAAAGVPIVGSRAGGVPEIVHEGVNGRVVEPGNVEQLHDAVGELLADRALAQLMGEAGRDLARREFAVDTMVERYLNLYCDLLHGSAATQGA